MPSDKPNVIVLVPHDMGQHIGCYGVETVRTPHMDRLAATGVRFARSFCTAPSCSPSRASIFTGRYPHSNGVMGLCHGLFAWDLHPDERHLAGILRDNGYETALIGIQHETRRPEQMGFNVILDGFRAPEVADTAVDWIAQQVDSEKPFYLQLGVFEPHRSSNEPFGVEPDDELGVTVPPFLVDEPSARKEFAEYQGAIRRVDDAVGRILHALDETGQRDNTIFVMTTDHGMPFPRAKCSLYDPGIETTLIVNHPAAEWEGGRVCEELISNVDYLPTLLEVLEIDIPDNVQGQSFAPYLRGADHEPRAEIFGEMTYHDYCDPRRCIRTENYKLIVNFTIALSFMDPSQDWRPKTITKTPENPAYAYHTPVELYDIVNDPWEQHDLADLPDHAATAKALLRRLHQWMKDTGDPLLDGIPPSPMERMAKEALATGKLDWNA